MATDCSSSVDASRFKKPATMKLGRAHPVQHIGQMGGQKGHRVYTGFKSASGGSGGPLVGHDGGPETVEDGADEDQPRGIGTDPEELEGSPRGPGESGKNLMNHAKHLSALEKMGEAVGHRAAAEKGTPNQQPNR